LKQFQEVVDADGHHQQAANRIGDGMEISILQDKIDVE
jgi:hypothetical protein